MKYVACLLTLIVFARHAGDQTLAAFLETTVKTAYYILGGAQETILWVVVGLFVCMQRSEFAKSMSIASCVIGIFEGLQIPFCRLLTLRKDYSGNTCDYIFGIPLGATMLSVYTIAVNLYLSKQKLDFLQHSVRILVTFIASAYIGITVHPLAGIAIFIISLAF